MKEYISTEEFISVLAEIKQKMADGMTEECREIVDRLLKEAGQDQEDITKGYIGQLTERRKNTRVADINRMLGEMSVTQIENVHKYTSDEYDEPNHEAEALDVIMDLSRRGRMDA